jgi:arylsulfatase A-like enzyme
MLYGGYRYLDERRPFLSKQFQENGYNTVGYHSNPHLGPEKNYNYGFSTFNDGAESEDEANTLINFVDSVVPSDSRLYSLLRRGWHFFSMATNTSAYAPASEITDRAQTWFEDQWDGESPYFMWLHYMDVHYPFMPPEEHLEEIGVDPLSSRRIADLNGRMQEDPESLTEEDRQDLLDLYDGEIKYVDHNIGRLLDTLEAHGVRDDTAIVVTADHGEAFGEHGRYGHHPLMYDELLHIPLIFDVPGFDSRRIDHQVSLIDVPPTLLDLCDIEIPERMQGDSLLPLLSGETDRYESKPVITTSQGGQTLATRTPEWKLLWDREEEWTELYDLQQDPDENIDVSDNNPEIVTQFKRVLQDYLDEARATDAELPDVEESEEVKERLEKLGYVD